MTLDIFHVDDKDPGFREGECVYGTKKYDDER
jgi:hypothetical protein